MPEPQAETRFRHELARKAIHFASAVIPLTYACLDRERMLDLLLPAAALVVAADLLRQIHPGLRDRYQRHWGHLMRDDEISRLSGAAHVMIAMVLCVWLFPRPAALAAMFFLSISDGLASLVGMRVGGPRWFGKSLAGSGAFFLSALAIALLCVGKHPLAGGVGAAVATVVEALPLRIGRARLDDNLTMPLAAGAVMWALGAG